MRKHLPIISYGLILVAAVASLAVFFATHNGFADRLMISLPMWGAAFLTAALAWGAYFTGGLAVRHVFRIRESFWEVDMGAGFIIFGMITFALAATHLLYAWVIRGIVLAILVLSAPTLGRFLRGARGYYAERLKNVSGGTAVLAAAIVPFGLISVLCFWQPPYEWDTLVYHFFLPKEFLLHHGFEYMPRLVYASMPMGAEMITTWAWGWGGLSVAAAATPLIDCLLLVATWRLARRYMENIWAVVAAVILLFTPTFAALLNNDYTDFILAAFTLMALNVYLRGLKRPGEAALAGLFLGAALAVKYTAIHALWGLLAIIIFDLISRRLRGRETAVMLGCALVVFAPWLVKAFVERGDPIFPVAYGVFGGRDLSPEAAGGIFASMRNVGMGRGLWDYVLLPYRVSMAGGMGYGNFAGSLLPFGFLALPLALVWFRRKRLIIFSAVAFISWGFIGSQQMRFLGPAFATLAVLLAGVFGAGADGLGSRARAWGRGVLIGVVLFTGYYLNSNQIVNLWERFWTHEIGGPEAYLARWAYSYKADKYVNENTPPDAVIIQLFDNSRLYLEREAVADPFCDASQIIYDICKMHSPGEVDVYFRRTGASYIILNKVAMAYFGSYYERRGIELLVRYLSDYSTLVYQDEGYEVRAIIR